MLEGMYTKIFTRAATKKKWKSPSPNVIEDNAPVLQWPQGRISPIYKGYDGLIKVCDVKTAKGTFKNPIHRLTPLFNDFHTDTPNTTS